MKSFIVSGISLCLLHSSNSFSIVPSFKPPALTSSRFRTEIGPTKQVIADLTDENVALRNELIRKDAIIEGEKWCEPLEPSSSKNKIPSCCGPTLTQTPPPLIPIPSHNNQAFCRPFRPLP